MTMGRGGDGFYLPRPRHSHILTRYLPIPSGDEKSIFILIPTPSSQWIIFLIKIKVFFSPERNVIMYYLTKRR